MILFKTPFSSHHSSIASGPVHELIALPVLSPFDLLLSLLRFKRVALSVKLK